MRRETVVARANPDLSDVETYWEAAKRGAGPHSYVALLGLRPQDALAIVKRVRQGLGFSAFERLQKNTRFSMGELAELVAIPERTLHRRREQGRLLPDESDRLLRVSRLFARAIELFEGDADAARAWLSTPSPALRGERPIALAGTDPGSREVETLIDRLEHGVLT